MGMTINESTEVLADYIDTYKICGGNGYNPATNITSEACEAFETAISTMRKYQKIRDKISTIYVGYRHGYEVMADIMEILREVEDGNNSR